MAAPGQQSIANLLYSIGKELTCPIWCAAFTFIYCILDDVFTSHTVNAVVTCTQS